MEEKNCTTLFEYLRSILYDKNVQNLDADSLDEPFQKLGKGLQYLDQIIQEMKSYSASLSRGTLSTIPPSRENPLCDNLKNIHANLNHLTWQAKQVAKGDYSQNVSYLGEFSEAFNIMTNQLKEREAALKREAESEKKHAYLVESYNQLLLELIGHSKEEILVTSVNEPRILYSSKYDTEILPEHTLYQTFLEELKKNQPEHLLNAHSFEWFWEYQDTVPHFYHVTTAFMEWQGENAYANILLDITEEKLREQKLTTNAYIDPLTGIHNRHFFSEKCKDILDTATPFVFCYCDLDHLKYVNDHFGHLEGDSYIQSFVNCVLLHLRKTDLFARIGGDEFCIILNDCLIEQARILFAQIQSDFIQNTEKSYSKNFSFGLVPVETGHNFLQMEDIIKTADHAMYQQKLIHQRTFNGSFAP